MAGYSYTPSPAFQQQSAATPRSAPATPTQPQAAPPQNAFQAGHRFYGYDNAQDWASHGSPKQYKPPQRPQIIDGDMAVLHSTPALPHNPPDFEGPLPGPRAPMSRKDREDDIYNQLLSGGYGSSLKNNPNAQGRRESNARDLARRLAGDGVADRYFDQYGVKRPGQAQPSQSPSQGTPYNPPHQPSEGHNSTPFDRYYAGDQGAWPQTQHRYGAGGYGQPSQGGYGQGGQQPDPMQQMWMQSMNAWTQPKQQLMQWGQQASQMPWAPNYANTPDSRPSPFSQQISGPFGSDPNTMYQNMGGFIQGVNNQAMQKPVGVYQGQGNPGAQYGKQNYDIRSLINQGNQMVQNGWQNPFMQQGQQGGDFPADMPWLKGTGGLAPRYRGY